MAGKKKKTTVTKVKKKKWMPIYAPEQFNQVLLGETYVAEEEQLNGKYITANLSTVVKSIRRQNMNVQFRVTGVEDGKAQTEIVGYSLINAAIKRLVRRGRDKVADSFLAKTKDKKVVRVKPLLITMNKGTKALQSALRLETRRVIREYAFTKNADDFLHDIVQANVQKKVKQASSKIFPVKTSEIRIAKLEENTNVIITEDGVKTEKVNVRSKDRGEDYDDGTKVKQKADQEEIYMGSAPGAAAETVSDEASSEDFGDDDESEDLENEIEIKKIEDGSASTAESTEEVEEASEDSDSEETKAESSKKAE